METMDIYPDYNLYPHNSPTRSPINNEVADCDADTNFHRV
jgi:hypothetical protein